ncbi:MAG TPA: HD domain-containing protein [Candidatus Omnitrophica bacterium]|nr:HD domain-containing protein [Candidatus Omnitrophota bacterium]
MIKEIQVPLLDLVVCLSEAIDLISPEVVNHHKQVAYIAFSIGEELGLSIEEQNELVLAGVLHDIGALSLKERIETLQFEIANPHHHAELGYLLLRVFKPFSSIAPLVRFHHVQWNKGEGSNFRGKPVSRSSHILHLADRVAVLTRSGEEVLVQVKGICEKIEKNSGKMFAPELVESFMSLSSKEYFWLDIVSPSISSVLSRRVISPTVELNLEGLLSIGKIFSQIIDFRSHFTATHSSGVALSAEYLARGLGFSERECQMMRLAGYLHDLGKLAVPIEILEKPAKLTVEEFNIIKSHTFHTYRVLENIEELEIINTWAAFHHERLDGGGYPFHLKGEDLSLGSRIMAVADVFTAITEDRPYRKGMDTQIALKVIQQMADNSALDPAIVLELKRHFADINSARISVQKIATEEYQMFGED